MKRFVVTVLGAAVFFLGIGALVENVGAKFKSDEKALDLIAKARQALGGDAAIAAIESMKIAGRSTHTFTGDGQTRTEQGEMELAFQFPNNMTRTYRFGSADGADKHEFVVRSLDKVSDPAAFAHGVLAGAREGDRVHSIVRTTDGKVDVLEPAVVAELVAKAHADAASGSGENREVRIYRKDGDAISTAEGTRIYLQKAETEAAFAAGGENAHKIIVRKEDGTFQELKGDTGGVVIATAPRAEIKARVAAEAAIAATPVGVAVTGGRQNDMLRTTLALLLTAPKGVDVSYAFGGESVIDGTACNIVVATSEGASYKIYLSQSSNLPVAMSFGGGSAPRVMFRRDATTGADANLLGRTTYKTADDANAETMVKYSDYRAVNGVQLPYRWTQTSGGNVSELFEVTSYEINPVDIAEKFQNQRVIVRATKKADGN
jgi:hypothetical protein